MLNAVVEIFLTQSEQPLDICGISVAAQSVNTTKRERCRRAAGRAWFAGRVPDESLA